MDKRNGYETKHPSDSEGESILKIQKTSKSSKERTRKCSADIIHNENIEIIVRNTKAILVTYQNKIEEENDIRLTKFLKQCTDIIDERGRKAKATAAAYTNSGRLSDKLYLPPYHYHEILFNSKKAKLHYSNKKEIKHITAEKGSYF